MEKLDFGRFNDILDECVEIAKEYNFINFGASCDRKEILANVNTLEDFRARYGEPTYIAECDEESSALRMRTKGDIRISAIVKNVGYEIGTD